MFPALGTHPGTDITAQVAARQAQFTAEVGARSHQTSVVLIWIAAVVFAACSDQPPPTVPEASGGAVRAQLPAVGSSIRGLQLASREERQAARQIARALALSLREQVVVDYVKAALASSAAREQKLHFASFLSGRGGPLLSGMLSSGMTMSQLGDALRLVRDLEFYMPVAAHRSQWTGFQTPLVAIALREEEPPEGYDSQGNLRILSHVFPPADPVLVLAPVETNLQTQIALNIRGEAERACEPRADETLTQAVARCSALASRDRRKANYTEVPPEVTGLYVTAIDLAGDECGGECWFWGDPEFEIYSFGKTPTSGNQMVVIQCSGDAAQSGFDWDMNGRTWAGRGLLLTRDQMNTVLQADTGWMHQLWEDDQDGCNLVPHVNPWTEAFHVVLGVYNAWNALMGPFEVTVVYAVHSTVEAIQNLIMGADDYVGTIVQEDASQFGDGQASTHNMVIVRGDNAGVFVGRATIKPYTSSGPYVGPVATVKISQPSSTMFPLGSGIQLWAYGLDSYGTHVPARPVSWSSSNSGVANVDANGFVTGSQEGSAMITSTIDGVSASTTVYPKAIGAPVAVGLDRDWVNLLPGQWVYVYARLYDSNGFEVPTPGNYEWTSADPSQCQVGYGSVDGEAYVVANGGTGALITVTSSEGLTDSMYCSSNGSEMRASGKIGSEMRASGKIGAVRR